jgi:NAD-dependent dihydropyrimidine dehydrogenase PreA subunit
MNKYNAYASVAPLLPNTPVTFTEACVGCNTCVNECRTDVLLPNPEKGKPPIVAYPDDCWYCGVCVQDCPHHANRFHQPLNQRVAWKRKATGEIRRPVD